MKFSSPVDDLLDILTRTNQQEAIREVYVSEQDEPRPGIVYVSGDNSRSGSKVIAIDVSVRILGNSEILFNAATDQARGQPISARIKLCKSQEGEIVVDVTAVINKTRRIVNSYEFMGRLRTAYRYFFPTRSILANFAANLDAGGWNQWCAPLNSGVKIDHLNFRGTDLTHFDFCCARFEDCDLSNCDLSGANLAGADLRQTKLDGVTVESTDFFGATLPRRYEYLPAASGLLEKESVKFV